MELTIKHKVNFNLKDDLPCTLMIYYQSDTNRVDYTDIRFIEQLNEQNINKPENIQEIINNPKIWYSLNSDLFKNIIHPDTKIDIDWYNDQHTVSPQKVVKFQLENLQEISQYPDNCFVKTLKEDWGTIMSVRNYKNEEISPKFCSYQMYFDLDNFDIDEDDVNNLDYELIANKIQIKLEQYIKDVYPEKELSMKFNYSSVQYDEPASFYIYILEMNIQKDNDFQHDILQKIHDFINEALASPKPTLQNCFKL